METSTTKETPVSVKKDEILDYAIEYCMTKAYPIGLSKDKKRAVRKRAKVISIVEKEVFIQRRKNKPKVHS